jgi:DNA-binding Lrp family transcriptional regulator
LTKDRLLKYKHPIHTVVRHAQEIDEKDQKILDELLEDASQSVTELAAKLKMPRTTVQERIRGLESLV